MELVPELSLVATTNRLGITTEAAPMQLGFRPGCIQLHGSRVRERLRAHEGVHRAYALIEWGAALAARAMWEQQRIAEAFDPSQYRNTVPDVNTWIRKAHVAAQLWKPLARLFGYTIPDLVDGNEWDHEDDRLRVPEDLFNTCRVSFNQTLVHQCIAGLWAVDKFWHDHSPYMDAGPWAGADYYPSTYDDAEVHKFVWEESSEMLWAVVGSFNILQSAFIGKNNPTATNPALYSLRSVGSRFDWMPASPSKFPEEFFAHTVEECFIYDLQDSIKPQLPESYYTVPLPPPIPQRESPAPPNATPRPNPWNHDYEPGWLTKKMAHELEEWYKNKFLNWATKPIPKGPVKKAVRKVVDHYIPEVFPDPGPIPPGGLWG
jgi:hypothetical protein